MSSFNFAQRRSSIQTTASSEDLILAKHNMYPDTTSVPLFSMYDLFEHLLKSKRISKSTIKKKCSLFLDFVTKHQTLGTNNSTLFRRISSLTPQMLENLYQDMNSDNTFFNPLMFMIFSYVFDMYLVLYLKGEKDVMSCQYFGLKSKIHNKVYMGESNFILLKKSGSRSVIGSIKNRCELQGANAIQSTKPIVYKCGYNVVNRKDLCVCQTKLVVDNKKITMDYTTENTSNKLYNINDVKTIPETDFYLKEQHIKIYETPKDNVRNPNYDTLTSKYLNVKGLKQDTHTAILETASSSLSNPIQASLLHEPKTPNSISNYENIDKTKGKLKFYNEDKEYGFITMNDGSEIFVHRADLIKQCIDTRYLSYYKQFYDIFVRFDIEVYQGKVKKHRKAVNVVIMDMVAIC